MKFIKKYFGLIVFYLVIIIGVIILNFRFNSINEKKVLTQMKATEPVHV